MRWLSVIGCVLLIVSGAPLRADDAPAQCQQLRQQFDALRAAARRDCDAASTCGCYPDLRIDGRVDISDAPTARALTDLSDRYRGLHCPTIFESQARPVRCQPRCQAHQCR